MCKHSNELQIKVQHSPVWQIR